MSSTFAFILRDILHTELGAAPSADQLAEVQTLLEENHLDTDANVPAWLRLFFTALHDREPLALRPRPDEKTDGDVADGDVGEFLAALTDLAPFDCYDYGEWVRVRLPRHGMLGFISVERAAYTVVPLSGVPDDGQSDLSRAKMLDRPA
jgi:hypothetical protein